MESDRSKTQGKVTGGGQEILVFEGEFFSTCPDAEVRLMLCLSAQKEELRCVVFE